MNLENWENTFKEKAFELTREIKDPSHDFLHICRVVKNAKKLQLCEGGRLEVILPATYFHDFVFISKDDHRRKLASTLSADAAIAFLAEKGYPEIFFEDIHNAIAAHSFSANLEAKIIEAKIVQDADRLDALGAIGVARCFALAGLMNRSFYHEIDPEGLTRKWNDQENTLDHFPIKLFQLIDRMQTHHGKKLAQKKIQFIKTYYDTFLSEVIS